MSSLKATASPSSALSCPVHLFIQIPEKTTNQLAALQEGARAAEDDSAREFPWGKFVRSFRFSPHNAI